MTKVKAVAIFLVIVFTILFCVTINSNAESFMGSLYSSPLYENNQCYK